VGDSLSVADRAHPRAFFSQAPEMRIALAGDKKLDLDMFVM
jgi:hypothetical protein